MSINDRPTVLACAGIQPELDFLIREGCSFEVRYLDQGLHQTPQKMAGIVQEALDALPPVVERVILGYGLCSKGVLGLASRGRSLVIPRQHDCVSFYLQSFPEADGANPRTHTYYLTPGWLTLRKDPLTTVEEVYSPRVGREKAVWAMNRELQHYQCFAFVDTGVCDPEPLRKRTMENAEFFGKQYREIPAALDHFRRLVTGPYSEPDFILLKPGETLEPSAWGL